MADNSKLEAFIRQLKEAERAMQFGDAQPYINVWSRGEEISAIGAGGNLMRGEQVFEGPKRVASVSRGSRNSIYTEETVRIYGEIAVVYWINECESIAVGESDYKKMKMAVTHVLKHEGERWSVLHRHNTLA